MNPPLEGQNVENDRSVQDIRIPVLDTILMHYRLLKPLERTDYYSLLNCPFE